MNTASAIVAIAVLAGHDPALRVFADPNPPLSPAEVAAGWSLLFDGTPESAARNFRAFRKPELPKTSWVVADGVLRTVKGDPSVDLVTADQYSDFELSLEYRCTPGANSGIMYRVTDKHGATYQTGPEFQVLDDPGVEGGKGIDPLSPHSAGAVYDLAPPAKGKVVKPAGEWNHARIRVKDGLLQHFLNGVKVVECRMDDQSWKDRIAASKFKSTDGFGVQPSGRISLQHHGDEVAYRSIKVRDFSREARLPGQIDLFNGKDLDNWACFLNDNGRKEDVWSVSDGVLVCKGSPAGYLRTMDDYTNYVLKVEWRWNPVTGKAGNSGVLLRVQDPDKVWPRSVEAQLQSGSAGDFWNIGEFKMQTEPGRTKGRNTRHTHAAERPIGEWNEYEIIVSGGDVVLLVNGEELNRAWQVEALPGKIALQSEGTEIHFRKVALGPIK